MSTNFEENPTSLKKQNNGFTLEVIVPIVFTVCVCAVLFVLAIFVSFTGNEGYTRMADIAIILMIAPMLLVFLVSIAVSFFIIKSLHGSDRSLAGFLTKSQQITSGVAARIQAVLSLTAQPVIKGKSFMAGTRSFFKTLNKRKNELEDK
jgi:hypothetical protein